MYLYKIKDLPANERPRERLLNVGVNNLSDKELISIILKTGTIGKDILNSYSLIDLKNITINDLLKIKGIGKTKAIELIASIELGKRIFLKESKKLIKLDNAKSIWEDSKYLFDGLKQEHFYCYYFNNKQELIMRKLMFIGTINNASVHTREIFREAYLLSAATIVCLHNHPSNDTTPSKEDINFTDKLMRTGFIQGIPVVDHIIVGENSFYSFYEHSNCKN